MCCPNRAGPIFEGVPAVMHKKPMAFSLYFPYPNINAHISRTQTCESLSSSVHFVPSSSLPDSYCDFGDGEGRRRRWQVP